MFYERKKESRGAKALLDFIIKYWLEVAFGLVCGAMAWFIKKYIKLYNDSKDNHEQFIIEEIQNKIDEQNKTLQKQMSECYNKLDTKIADFIKTSEEADVKLIANVGNIKADILAIEGAYFKSECRKLLEPEHIMTQEEFDTITVEHGAYNGLGGNHEGDMLYELVKEKQKKQLMQKINNSN